MPRRQGLGRRLSTAARWPAGVALTSWRYMWRTTAVHRWEMSGSPESDAPPPLAPGIVDDDLQRVEEGVGPLIHRMYRTRMVGTSLSPQELMARVMSDLDEVAPSEFATFQKLSGEERLSVGDEYIVRMPGPWDGPVRVAEVGPTAFRLVTLRGHLEAGQIEFRTDADYRSLGFTIESWARSGDRLSDLMYSHLRIAKEVQLHMWTSVLGRVVKLSGGRMDGGIVITTRRVDWDGSASEDREQAAHEVDPQLAALAERPVNFDVAKTSEYTPANGWHWDDMIEPLPHEPSGPPVDGGSWQVARDLMDGYQLADPATVRAVYRKDAPLAGRDMLLKIRFAFLRFDVGVRIGDVYEETREVDGRPAHVFGWSYRTLEGHFEQGQMHYEVWKWLDTGDVHFRLYAFSRAARSGPLWMRVGFRVVGRQNQLRFYRGVCRRVRRLTEAELEARAVGEG